MISGKIGSGKTFLAENLSKKLNCNSTSFSKYIKFKCNLENIKIDRHNLQILGQDCVENDLENFVNYITLNNFEKKSDILIIDGLRHLEVLEYIKNRFTNTIHIHIDIPENIRIKNIINRDGKYEQANEVSEIENNYNVLKDKANMIIHDCRNFSQISKEILDYINNFQQMSFLNSNCL